MIPWQRKHECEIVKERSKMFELAVPGFGASDCRCAGHLFYVRQLP
jgi:Uri superfamily endonuclease